MSLVVGAVLLHHRHRRALSQRGRAGRLRGRGRVFYGAAAGARPRLIVLVGTQRLVVDLLVVFLGGRLLVEGAGLDQGGLDALKSVVGI